MNLTERAKGVLLMLGASVCFSSGGLMVRLADSTPPAAIVFWRSGIVFLFLLALLGAWHGRRLPRMLREGGGAGALSALFLGATFCCFIFAVTRTMVANAAALMSTGPLMLTATAWLFLGEKAPAATWFAIEAAIAGIALMFADGLGAGGAMTGNLLALGIPVSFTASYLILRRFPGRLDPGVTAMVASLFAALAMLPFAWPLAWPDADLPVLVAMGILQTGMGLLLLMLAVHRLSAAELGMVGLLEMVLAPVWVWVALAERPTDTALAGGVIVVGAVFANQLWLVRSASRPRAG